MKRRNREPRTEESIENQRKKEKRIARKKERLRVYSKPLVLSASIFVAGGLIPSLHERELSRAISTVHTKKEGAKKKK